MGQELLMIFCTTEGKDLDSNLLLGVVIRTYFSKTVIT